MRRLKLIFPYFLAVFLLVFFSGCDEPKSAPKPTRKGLYSFSSVRLADPEVSFRTKAKLRSYCLVDSGGRVLGCWNYDIVGQLSCFRSFSLINTKHCYYYRSLSLPEFEEVRSDVYSRYITHYFFDADAQKVTALQFFAGRESQSVSNDTMRPVKISVFHLDSLGRITELTAYETMRGLISSTHYFYSTEGSLEREFEDAYSLAGSESEQERKNSFLFIKRTKSWYYSNGLLDSSVEKYFFNDKRMDRVEHIQFNNGIKNRLTLIKPHTGEVFHMHYEVRTSN